MYLYIITGIIEDFNEEPIKKLNDYEHMFLFNVKWVSSILPGNLGANVLLTFI